MQCHVHVSLSLLVTTCTDKLTTTVQYNILYMYLNSERQQLHDIVVSLVHGIVSILCMYMTSVVRYMYAFIKAYNRSHVIGCHGLVGHLVAGHALAFWNSDVEEHLKRAVVNIQFQLASIGEVHHLIWDLLDLVE